MREINGQTWGLVAPCLKQARCWLRDWRVLPVPDLGMAGERNGASKADLGIDLFSAGVTDTTATDATLSTYDPLSGHYRRLLTRDGKLHGVLLMGDCHSAAPLTDLLAQGATAHSDWLFDRFDTQPSAAGQMTMTKPTLAVVGHGMVGHHFLEQCVSRNLHLHYHIVVFGEERYCRL